MKGFFVFAVLAVFLVSSLGALAEERTSGEADDSNVMVANTAVGTSDASPTAVQAVNTKEGASVAAVQNRAVVDANQRLRDLQEDKVFKDMDRETLKRFSELRKEETEKFRELKQSQIERFRELKKEELEKIAKLSE